MARTSVAKKQEIIPESITEELQFIQVTNGGLLEPAKVVEYARNPETLLHKEFEWDDSKAAEGYRLWQARMIIRLQLTVVDTKTENPANVFLTDASKGENQNRVIRSFVSLTAGRFGESRGYRNIYDVLADHDLRAHLLEDAKRDMNLFRRKYHLLKELAGVFEAMDKV